MEENKTGKQPETAKKNERGRKESQPLTPEEIRKRRKMLVYPLLFLVFGVAMWLIFAPSDEGESLQDKRTCLRTSVPPTNSRISSASSGRR